MARTGSVDTLIEPQFSNRRSRIKMVNVGWSERESPFHEGEREIQARVGVRERIEAQGRRMIRDYLTEQHRQFFAQLPFLIAGTIDRFDRVWASILVGNPGFLSARGDRTLEVSTQPLFGDPIAETLVLGADIGLLGIELATRRRNRMNGMISSIDPASFSVRVGQSFGNCPQYIQARQILAIDSLQDLRQPESIEFIETLDTAAHQLVTNADTFFIATTFQTNRSNLAEGIDVSHRGGKPGFVRVDDGNTLVFPDFSGNLHFSTIGNLLLDPRAGLLFIDFESGDLLYLTGTAQTIWDSDEIRAFAGAERAIYFTIIAGYRVKSSLPLRWSTPERSPFLENTGTWQNH